MGTDDVAKLKPDLDDPGRFKTMFISDPMDRSAILKNFIASHDGKKTLWEILGGLKAVKRWEETSGASAAISGATSAITCVRRGLPIFAVIVNYVTQQLFLSCAAGNYILGIPLKPEKIDLRYILKHGAKLTFRKMDTAHHEKSMRRFVTFTGKSGYRENLEASRLMDPAELEANLYYSLPGGPSRMLYLSSFQPEADPLGFILANGEKIGEWIHWLPFARFAKLGDDQSESAFRIFEMYASSAQIKDEVFMATPPAYSIFQPSATAADHRLVLDVQRVSSFINPSKIRATLIVVPSGNSLMTLLTRQYGHREIIFDNG